MIKLLPLIFFILISCNEITKKSQYKELAQKKANEKNCDSEIELLLTHDRTELWASYHNKDKQLLCVFTCMNKVCIYSTERD